MEKKLITTFLGYLMERRKSLDEEARESVDVSVQCLSEVFGIKAEDLCEKTLAVDAERFLSLFSSMCEGSEKAENMKAKGNNEMANKNYQKAAEYYSSAIQMDERNPIYYSNRAAAYLALEMYEQALEDSKKAIDLDKSYAKAYIRLGQSYFHLNKMKESLEAYETAKSLDPSNKTIEDAIAKVKGTPGIDPKIVDMAKNMFGGDMVENLLKNPAVSELAQKFCSDPSKLQNLMNAFMSPKM